MSDYLIGCTHFGHESIIKLAGRPFDSLEHMEATMIENWNRVVKPKDTVYHLGDFAYKGLEPEVYEKMLNGTIIRVQGNHDRRHWGADYLEFKKNKRKIVLMHYPLEEWNGWYHGAVHFHAHTHQPNLHSALRRGNVTVEAIDYTPILLERAVERVLGDLPEKPFDT